MCYIVTKVSFDSWIFTGTVIAILTVIALLIRFCVKKYAIDDKGFEVNDLHEWVSFVIIGITVLVIAVPEGLPLAVTLALAYSVKVLANFIFSTILLFHELYFAFRK